MSLISWLVSTMGELYKSILFIPTANSLSKAWVHLYPKHGYIFIQSMGTSLSKAWVHLYPKHGYIFIQSMGASLSRAWVHLYPKHGYIFIQSMGTSCSLLLDMIFELYGKAIYVSNNIFSMTTLQT